MSIVIPSPRSVMQTPPQHQNRSQRKEPQSLHIHHCDDAVSRQHICVKRFACFALCLLTTSPYTMTSKLSEGASLLCRLEHKVTISAIIKMSAFVRPEHSNISSSFPIVHHGNIDDNSNYIYLSRLPTWFHEYVQFHNEAIQELSRNISSYVNYKYLLLRCVPRDVSGKATCFGASDRLQMVPVMLKLAYQFRRIFFIYWEHPFQIEEFLLPNTNVLNWSLPQYLIQPLDVKALKPLWYFYYEREKGMDEGTRVIRMKAMVRASFHYDLLRFNNSVGIPIDEPPLRDVYSDFWKALFVPSPGVRNSIHATLRDLDLLAISTQESADNLVASETTHFYPLISNIRVKPYISVHIRANHFEDKSHIHLEENAIRCAKKLSEMYIAYAPSLTDNQSLPIYIASDAKVIVHRAKQYAYDQHQLQVVSRNYTSTPYHIDHPPALSTSNETMHPSDFYDTFVDLYVMAMGQCSSYGVGGFGLWSATISYLPSKDDRCRSIDHNLIRC